MLTKMRREPPAHFLLIGLARFAVYNVAKPGTNLASSPRRIEVTTDDQRQRQLELREWFHKNSGRVAQRGRASFRHLCSSFDRRREHARDDATRALSAAAGKQSDLSATAASADPFLLESDYGDRTPEHLLFPVPAAKAAESR